MTFEKWIGRSYYAQKHMDAPLFVRGSVDRTIRLKNYIENNIDILVNYNERKNKNLPFTSQVAESTVENLVNSRCRQTKKMQWLREGTHALLQVKCAHYCNSFAKIWEYVMPKLTQKTAQMSKYCGG